MLFVPVQALASPYGKVGAGGVVCNQDCGGGKSWSAIKTVGEESPGRLQTSAPLRAVTGSVMLNTVRRAGTGDLAGRDLYLHALPESQSEHGCADRVCSAAG